MAATLPLADARKKLALLWFPVSGAIFLMLVIQTFTGALGSRDQAVWGWALPNFLPTLALMGSVFAADAIDPVEGKVSVVRRFFFRLAFWMSAFYFLILLIVFLAPVFQQMAGGAAATPDARFSAMERSNIFLGPLQGVVAALIGVLFTLKGKKKSGGEGEEEGEE